MGLSLRGVAVGAMERASEIIQEERAEAKNLVDSSIKMWTEMGLPVFRARKKQRRELEQAADILKNEGFSNDQIYTAMRQGKHQAVIDHVGSLKKRNLAVKPADIITFAQDDAGYQSTGMTMDQVLDGVMGKLDTGMSLSDAIADTTGKNIGGIQAALMKKRAGAVQSAFGIDPTELRSLARQDFTYGEDIGGTLNIVDPEAAAKAQAAMRGKGVTGASSRYGRFFKRFGNALGFNADYRVEEGQIVPVYPDDAADLAGQAMDLATEANVIVARLMSEGKASSVEEAERMAQQEILKRLQQSNDPQDSQDPPEDPEQSRDITQEPLTDSEKSQIKSAQDQAIQNIIDNNLTDAFGLISSETRAAIKQTFVTLLLGMGFSQSQAEKVAESNVDIIMTAVTNKRKEQEKIEQQKNIPDIPSETG